MLNIRSMLNQASSLVPPIATGKTLLLPDSLTIPVFVAVLSMIVLAAHTIPISYLFQRLKECFRASTLGETASFAPVFQHESFSTRIKECVVKNGGKTAFAYKVARLSGCLGLFSLSVYSGLAEYHGDDATGFGTWGKEEKYGYTYKLFLFVRDPLALGMCVVYMYASILALVSILTAPWRHKPLSTHLNILLVLTFGVYFYRDIFPLTTYTRSPLDLSEGWVLWTKITLLALTSVIIPLLIPRQYVPIDPKCPMAVPNPEQTASLLSLVLYSFLDPIIFLAYRLPHLSHDQLPALSDYDYAQHLKAKSFPHLDTYTGSKKRHIFFGLMRVFRWEYTILGAMIVVHVISSFAAPVGIRELLRYLETRGKNATIRPWFWIVWLFVGPTIGSISWQWYIYIATRTVVRVECIITQLVFEHSLRIRVKAEADLSSSDVSSNTSTASTSETSSIGDNLTLDEERPQAGTIGCQSSSSGTTEVDTLHSRDDTLQASSSSIDSESPGKDKTKTLKAEKLEGHSNADNLVGKINNLVTTDLANIMDSRDFLLVLVYIPFQITLCIVFLYIVLGWSAFIGLATILSLFPIPGYVAKCIQDVQVTRLKTTDARVQTVTETMNVLRMIKLFGWEKKIKEKIADKREKELVWIWRRQILDLINGNLNFLIPVATMVTTYSTYGRGCVLTLSQTVLMKQELNASTVFSSMAVFDMLRDQLHLAFFAITELVTGKVSLDRVNDFLQNTELLDSFSENQSTGFFCDENRSTDDRIGFRNATFTWSSDTEGSLTPSKRRFALRIENELLFKPGHINLIIGPTGSGKTSLLMALLGEMHFLPSGPNSWYNLPRHSGIAYAAQESWVQNETIKENIIFGAPFDEERYKKVLYQCSLERDLALFEAGDRTEVGEKGLTLSGGQKARITLARAIYSQAAIILLDDVLAALDVHTAKWIIDKCFTGELIRGRTILLVTHNIAMTRPIAQFVVSMGVDGNILCQGSISDVLLGDGLLAEEVAKEEQALVEVENEADLPRSDEPKPNGKLIVAEEVEEGHVSWAALKLYFLGLGGNHSVAFFFTFGCGLILTELLNVTQTWYLGHWASQYDKHAASEIAVFHYLGIYGTLLLFAVTLYCLSFVVYIYGVLRASKSLHAQLVESILGTTLRWLDVTPTSRVIARCTQDIRAVDGPISNGLRWLSEMTVSMLVKFGAVVLLTPAFLFPGILVAGLGSWCGQIYIAAQLSVKREMSNAKAPVLGHFGAAIAGLISIRAYGVQKSFQEESLHRINRYTRAARTFYNLNRWICIRIDAIGGLFAAALAAYLVYFQGHTAANTGFSLNMAVGFSGMILWWVRVLNDFEVQGNSLERIQGYIHIEQEPKATENGVPPAYWPASGDIRVEKLAVRYSRNGPKVLHDISFHITSGERIGVVGRTGSGKSSLTLSLLRCIFTEGDVYYDGLNTNAVNLDALRSNITIIPQTPELLSGTLRQNLDPFEQYDDATLNDALRAAGLFSLQNEMDEGRITLDSTISSGGGNLSVGQRQILALARAIVRGSKLLILDEATSAIDYKTDAIIQSSLRHELRRDVTLITVAHRLQTIMDADRIMVLDAGHLIEFDTPKELLKRPDSKLRALVDESGDRDLLYAMAEGSSGK